MAFNVENASGSALGIDDLGITLDTSEIIDLSVQGSFDTIVGSIQAGEEISNLILAGDLIVKDPNDGVTNLSIADGLACARALGDPNYRVGLGAILGDISDITISAPVDGEALTYIGGDWVNASGGTGFSGLGIWRYRTAITSTPSSGQLQFDNTTIDSATELYVNVINDDGTDMSAFLALITSGSLLYIQIQSDSSQFVAIEVGTSSILSGVYTFPITTIEAQGTTPSNNTRVALVASGSGSGGGSVFGTEQHYAESLAQSSTTTQDPSWTQKLKLTTAILPIGTYLVMWSCSGGINKDLNGKAADIQLEMDDTTQLGKGSMRVKFLGVGPDSNVPETSSGFAEVTFGSAAVHDFDIDFRISTREAGTAYILNARIELWRIS